MLRHYADLTGQKKLCLAGGVALNCVLNQRIIESKIFDEIFVQPASSDAGMFGRNVCSGTGGHTPAPIHHTYLGASVYR
ncbi:MAG: hypothetical protein IPN22_11430 [Bacteroidetes bacterium]|nr:hypothetical protein [Bacteroidota bacterium]